MLAYAMDVDFEIVSAMQVYDPNWNTKLENGEITKDQLRTLANENWGVLKELHIQIKAIKS